MLTRRTLLHQALRTSAALALGPHLPAIAQNRADSITTLSLTGAAAVPLAPDFIGLGYEMSSVASPGLLSPSNAPYVQLLRNLGPAGVLRVGGIVADYTRYQPAGPSLAQPQNTVLSRASLEQFAAFLKITGWQAIWSLNFAQGTLAEAIVEARAVAQILGPRLLAFELGNEVDNYFHGQHPFRPDPYTFAGYRAEFTQWHDAILQAVPAARFAAPDTATNLDWVEAMAADPRGQVQLLTTHYYRNGQKRGSAEQLLQPDPRLAASLTRLRAASRASGIPYRICETNSFSGGGLPGVSNTFLGALWTLDFFCLLATYGAAGVNLETGVNQLGFVSSYSPIQDDGYQAGSTTHGQNTAGIPYYGMLAFRTAARGADSILPTTLTGAPDSLTAYLLGNSGKPHSLIVINRDPGEDATLPIARLLLRNPISMRLTAPAQDSITGITFGHAAVDSAGRWAGTGDSIPSGTLTIPRMSACVLVAT